MIITKDEVQKVALLSRLKLDEDKISLYAEQIEKILEYVAQLEKIDTHNVPCTTRAIEVTNVFREDEPSKFNSSEQILCLSPERENNFYKVPKIIAE